MANTIGAAKSSAPKSTSPRRNTNTTTNTTTDNKAAQKPASFGSDGLAKSTERLLAQGGMDGIASDTSRKMFEMNNPDLVARQQTQGGTEGIANDTQRMLDEMSGNTPNRSRENHFSPELKEKLDALLNL